MKFKLGNTTHTHYKTMRKPSQEGHPKKYTKELWSLWYLQLQVLSTTQTNKYIKIKVLFLNLICLHFNKKFTKFAKGHEEIP